MATRLGTKGESHFGANNRAYNIANTLATHCGLKASQCGLEASFSEVEVVCRYITLDKLMIK